MRRGKLPDGPGAARAEAAPAGTGALAWLMQRVTAVLVAVALGTHTWVLHFAIPGEKITFERVAERLHSPFFMTLDLLLLAAAIYHSLNGVRAVILDFGLGSRGQVVLLWVLWILGLIAFVYGANALLPFFGSQALF